MESRGGRWENRNLRRICPLAEKCFTWSIYIILLLFEGGDSNFSNSKEQRRCKWRAWNHGVRKVRRSEFGPRALASPFVVRGLLIRPLLRLLLYILPLCRLGTLHWKISEEVERRKSMAKGDVCFSAWRSSPSSARLWMNPVRQWMTVRLHEASKFEISDPSIPASIISSSLAWKLPLW